MRRLVGNASLFCGCLIFGWIALDVFEGIIILLSSDSRSLLRKEYNDDSLKLKKDDGVREKTIEKKKKSIGIDDKVSQKITLSLIMMLLISIILMMLLCYF